MRDKSLETQLLLKLNEFKIKIKNKINMQLVTRLTDCIIDLDFDFW